MAEGEAVVAVVVEQPVPVALRLSRDLPVAAAGGVKLLECVADPRCGPGVAKGCRARIAGERRVLVERVLRRVRIFLLDLEAGMDRLPPRPRYVKGVDVEGGDVGLHEREEISAARQRSRALTERGHGLADGVRC